MRSTPARWRRPDERAARAGRRTRTRSATAITWRARLAEGSGAPPYWAGRLRASRVLDRCRLRGRRRWSCLALASAPNSLGDRRAADPRSVGARCARMVPERRSILRAEPWRRRRLLRAGKWHGPGSIGHSCTRHALVDSAPCRLHWPFRRLRRTSNRAQHPQRAGTTLCVRVQCDTCS